MPKERASKKPERPSPDPAGAGDHKPVLDAVIEAVSALSELAKSLRARAREAAEEEKRSKGKKKGTPKIDDRKADTSAPRSAAAVKADAKPALAGEGVKRRLKKAWEDLTAPESLSAREGSNSDCADGPRA